MANERIFKRYQGNPIVTAEAVPTANTIFNSAVVKFNDGFAGVFRIDSQAVLSELHIGFSHDGISWEIKPERIYFEDSSKGMITPNYPESCCYDPRVTQIDDVYYITWCHYPAYPKGKGPAIGLAKTTDFKRFEILENILLPYNRNAVLFPRRIGGQYGILHRPSDHGQTAFGDIYYSSSPDMINWGRHRFVMGPCWNFWQSTKIGAGPVPIETSDGWLMIYHGVKASCSGFVYSVGGAILDLEKPWKVLYRTKTYLLAPTTDYERVGDTPNVVFPCAATVDKNNRITMYYGCADTSLGIAYAELDELVQFIKNDNPV